MAFLVNYQSHQGASGEGILGKDPISLTDNVFNTTATSLTLNGKGVINYGEVQQENFVRMLENFASATAPLNPTIGQLWFNASDYNVYVCVDVTNANVIAAGVTPIQVISGKGWVKTSSLGGGGGGGGGSGIGNSARQSVLSGPTGYFGDSNFGGITGSTSVTASGTLTVTAANGFASGGQVDRIGSITNPTWTGLNGINGNKYLYLDINADGSCTTGSTTSKPIYKWGASYTPVTSGQFTFDIQHMTGVVGNGSTTSQVYRVFVGEVICTPTVVASIIWYALQGKSITTTMNPTPAAGTHVIMPHYLGCTPKASTIVLTCIGTDNGYSTGDTVLNPATQYGGGYYYPSTVGVDATYVWYSVSNANSFMIPNRSSPLVMLIDPTKWEFNIVLDRGW